MTCFHPKRIGGATRPLLSFGLALAGAFAAIFVTGTKDVLALSLAGIGAGAALLVGHPRTRLEVVPVAAAVMFVMASAASLLPLSTDNLPRWRQLAPEAVQLSSSGMAAMPLHTSFWLLCLIIAVTVSCFLASAALSGRILSVFLQVVSLGVAIYAVLSIAQFQTEWSYPFSGGANFGILPNRNHTAIFLVVGSIISFGLMHWHLTRGHRPAALLSAACGAPCLAALLFFSTSRAGVLLLAVGFALWLSGALNVADSRKKALVGAVVLLVFLSALFVFGGSAARDRLDKLWSDLLSVESGEVDFRVPIFQDTAGMIADSPMTGHGLGHFGAVFPQYREASLRAVRVLHPESDWLMVAAESGLPALVFVMVLAGWYFVRCWRARATSDGLLRWTVASAIGASMLHGFMDVPWHRPALGWFLTILAVAALPSTEVPLRHPLFWRGFQILGGILLLAFSLHLGFGGEGGRIARPYSWKGYEQELRTLAANKRFEDGELLAQRAADEFPLRPEAYYWRAAFARVFEGSDHDMKASIEAGRFVDPVLPTVAAEQAQLWVGIDPEMEGEARVEAIRRSRLLDQRLRTNGSDLVELESGIRAAQERPAVQVELRKQLGDDPVLVAQWARLANADVVDEFFGALAGGATAWLDGLPPDLRGQVLDRWITLPSAAGAVAYMEERNAPAPGAYWRQLAEYYAKAGDKARAVRMVAEAEGLPLDGPLTGGEFGVQLAGLEAQGNTVSVRRLLKETAEGGTPDPDKLRVAMSWYAAAGDWEMAWRAASRLATATKNRQ